MGVRDTIAKAIMGIKAYHSSPHDFDKFDLKKIGTGEGAQAYGHGLYFAENPAVSGQGGQYWNQFANKFRGPESSAANMLKLKNFDRDAAIDFARQSLAREEEALRVGRYVPHDPTTAMSAEQMSWHPALIDKHREALRMLESGAPVGPRTYEVNIKADPAQMLDWDKPLTAQHPAILDLARGGDISGAMGTTKGKLRRFRGNDEQPGYPATGQDLYRGMSAYGENPVRAAETMREGGVPGIKYLDEGSRAIQPAITDIERAIKQGGMYKGAGPDMWASRLDELKATPLTNNYVVFDPANIDILKKYGVVGAPAGALGMGALADQSQYEVQP